MIFQYVRVLNLGLGTDRPNFESLYLFLASFESKPDITLELKTIFKIWKTEVDLLSLLYNHEKFQIYPIAVTL